MIYFVQETELFRNRVKIGFTEDIRKRMQGLRCGSASTLKVVLVLPGDMKTEAAYHEYFAKYRLHGEWFRFGWRLRMFIRTNQHVILSSNCEKPTLPPAVAEDPKREMEPDTETNAGMEDEPETEIEIETESNPPIRMPDPLKPEEIEYALANPMGINRLSRALSIGSGKAKRLKEHVDNIKNDEEYDNLMKSMTI
jgi:hypothetical protein